ncbi:MAG: site-specific DNA-methyltransferase, partial [Candidatus Accumulibacter sp.]|uniref:site-specific DNA-methyltransferase n=1 Tax=Accumulibacter sp. TaxID=2053492 RepID=UPI002879E22B
MLAREDVERDLFADPQHDYAQAVQFYQHDVDWANRMILGDSLQVMASLARREDLAGKVQMIYLDPPYGIKFASNFQPQLGQRDVKDREQDLTREPEMVKAYRDTWTLGIHSYLAYLRDRLAMARELLTDSGSIFVQISDDNLHRVRCVMDEVFGVGNFCAIISFQKTGSMVGNLLPTTVDFLLWYARDIERVKYKQIYQERRSGATSLDRYDQVLEPTGLMRRITEDEQVTDDLGPLRRFQLTSLFSDGASTKPQAFPFRGNTYEPKGNAHWKTDVDGGLRRLGLAERVEPQGDRLRYVRLASDFNLVPLADRWESVQIGTAAIYVVQTSTTVVERCLLMTTDPGDLVLDPTCGSGTTAYVAEQLGRRWITCDSSRVALALAKHRLLTAKFDYQQLRSLSAEDVARNPNGTWLTDPTGKVPGKATFRCKTVPHITLKSIARNTSLDPIFARHEPILAEKLTQLNREVATVGAVLKGKLVEKLIHKHRESGANAMSDADTRRWLLPDTQAALIRSFPARSPLKGLTTRQAEAYRAAIPKGGWQEWEVPFDTDPDWPSTLQDALTAYRAAWRAKMDEVNACIAANAEMEELVDKPEPVKGIVRVTGPFSMELTLSHNPSADGSAMVCS